VRSGSTEPLRLYSKKYKRVSDFPVGSTTAIPNDPTNERRALILLQAKGLITLKPDAGFEASTPCRIRSSPKAESRPTRK
jgi:D-methionine transport system substrate-binding protein